MSLTKRIVFIPIDNRPVCYNLARDIAQIDENIELLMPEREWLGDLSNSANIEAIYNWLYDIEYIDAIILPLDTIAYGGLVPSRRCEDTLKDIELRMIRFCQLLEQKKAKVYAFSSIMRISNNNVNEEEKEYWNLYGKKIFEYSYLLHKNRAAQTDVPADVIQDYLLTRKRNFDMNRRYLEWQEEGLFETLVFSKDDCAEFGLNVQEAQLLTADILKKKLCTMVKTGADEIPLSLLSRAIVGHRRVKIAPVFTQPEFTNKISKYEDISVLDSVEGQIELAGCEVSDSAHSDIILLVNNFKESQGELVMNFDVEGFNGEIELPSKPFVIADIVNANGADNKFVQKLFDTNFVKENFLGYAAWNTTGNTLGSAICGAVVKFLASDYNEDAFKKLQMIRFLDDWAYQANLRKYLKFTSKDIDKKLLKETIKPFEKLLNKKFKTNYENIDYEFPWGRFFEVEVDIK